MGPTDQPPPQKAGEVRASRVTVTADVGARNQSFVRVLANSQSHMNAPWDLRAQTAKIQRFLGIVVAVVLHGAVKGLLP